MSGPDGSTWFGIAACITALGTVLESAQKRREAPRRRRRSTGRRSTDAAPPPVEPDPPPAAARVGVRALLTIGFLAAFLTTGHAPAYGLDVVAATHPVLSGSTSCDVAGERVVDWSIGNSQVRRPMVITVAIATTPDGRSWPVSGYLSPIPPSGVTNGRSVLPGAEIGPVVLAVTGSWPSGRQGTREASVAFSGPCPVPSTTTTSSPAPSTTRAPQPGTVSTTPPATSSPSVSAPPATSAAPNSPMLANTGSPVADAVVLGLSVTALGCSLLIVIRRRRRPYAATDRRRRARRSSRARARPTREG